MKRILLVLIILAALPFPKTLAYEIKTHQYLTEETVDFFNRNYPELAIDEQLKKRLVKGAAREDDFPRFFNHFYDPIYDRGLTIGQQSWISSKLWSRDEVAQEEMRPHTLLAQMKPESYPSNFTWQRALELYRKGKESEALEVVGHILHLIQDAAVPDHTRNDPHGDGSPYEDFAAGKKVGDLGGFKPYVLESLDDYFNQMANYSNNNFFSKDTIESKKYYGPKINAFKLDVDGFYYAVSKDDFGEYLLYQKPSNSLLIDSNNISTLSESKIMGGYWNRLSKKAVQYGAGVLRLFLEEAGEIDGGTSQGDTNSSPSSLREAMPAAGRQSDLGSGTNDVEVGVGGVSPEVDDEVVSNDEIPDRVGNDKSGVRSDTVGVWNNNLSLALGIDGRSVSGASGSGVVFMVSKDAMKEEGWIPHQVRDDNFVMRDDGGGISQGGTNSSPSTSSGTNSFGDGGGGVGTGERPLTEENPIDIKITEFLFDAIGSDAGQEFIELYNLGETAVDLSGWSIQIGSPSSLREAGDFGSGFKKKNFEEGDKIDAKSYFLIWLGGEAPAGVIDGAVDFMIWKSGSLKNTADKIYLVKNREVIIGDDDVDIVDKVSYVKLDWAEFEAGDSLIKKDNGFVIDKWPSPAAEIQQLIIGDFKAVYNRDDLLIDLSWLLKEPTAEARRASVSYKVYDISDTASSTLIYSGAAVSYQLPINEVGRDYKFRLVGEAAGRRSELETVITTPSFLASLVYYEDSNNPGSYLVDLNYDSYPFVPGGKGGWKILLFFKNKSAENRGLLMSEIHWQPAEYNDLMIISYPTEQSTRRRVALILPDAVGGSGVGGGVTNVAMNFDAISESSLRFGMEEVVDYLTVAYYDFESSGGGSQNFKLKALDRSKYYFQANDNPSSLREAMPVAGRQGDLGSGNN